MKRILSYAATKQSGVVAVLFAIVLPLLIGFAALAIDVGYIFLMKSKLQVAADSAALVAAGSIKNGQGVDAATAWALKATAANGFTDQLDETTVTVSIPPGGTESYAQDSTYVQVTVAQKVPTFLAPIFGVNSTLASATAIAGTTGGSNPCLLALGTTGAGALSVGGNANITAKSCGLFVNSNNAAAIQVTGNATVSAGSISVVGGISKKGDVTVSPAPQTGASSTKDPFLAFPKPTFAGCTYTGFSKKGNGSIALTPGTYCGGISITGNNSVSMAAGMYVLYGGGFNIGGNVSPINGTNVTIYNTGSGSTGANAFGSINLTGNVVLNLSAPLKGNYSGMLIYQDVLNVKNASIGGNAGSVLAGNLYFPSGSLTLSGNSETAMPTGSVVAQKVTLSGNTNLSMTNIYGSSGSSNSRSALYK